jgi:acyl-coenzyme A thioesterase PaaI-like protein
VASDRIPDPWHTRRRAVPPHSEHFASLVIAVRELQDAVTGANPPDDVVRAAMADVERTVATLRPYEVEEWDAPAGKLDRVPGRAQPFLPPFSADHETVDSVRGHVTFTRAFLGGNGAVHGGAVPLLFDEVLGRLSNAAGRKVARTAYLHVDYRHITPVGVQLALEAQLEREEGRKRWVRGRLSAGDTLCAEAEGLFVVLKPGQP